MRLIVASILTGILLTGCGLRERFGNTEDRINTALPPDSGTQAARQLFLAQIGDQPDVQKVLEPMWEARLRLRALSCSPDYSPTWRESNAEVRARLTNTSCFAEKDRLLQRWLGLQRVRLMLAQGPIRPMPQELPPLISHDEFITSLVVAREAPVAIMQGASGFAVVELATGKSLFKEATPFTSQGFMELSPNGRLFTQASSGKVSIRAVTGGETLVELPQTYRVLWLDSSVIALRSNNAKSLRLLDLTTGEDTPVPGNGNGDAYIAVRAPGEPNRFDLLLSNGVVQIEIIKAGGRYEAQLRADKQNPSGRGFAINTGGLSADGTTWIDGNQGLRVLNLDTLELQEPSFKPVGTQMAWPTPNPQEFLISMHLPSGDGVTSRFNYYLYNHGAGTLAQVTPDSKSNTRYQYLGSIKRLALIDNQSVRYIDKLNASEPHPVDSVVTAFIDEMNQRHLAAASVQQKPMIDGLPAAPGRLGEPSQPQQGVRTVSPLQAQLSDAEVEGVGVYEGGGAKHGIGQKTVPGVVEVRVRRSARPIALVLSSYEPVRWTIVTEPGAKISAVLLSGYYESTVVGAGSARIYQIGQDYAYAQQSPEYAKLQRTVMTWTGKKMTIFQGRYAGSNFSVGHGN